MLVVFLNGLFEVSVEIDSKKPFHAHFWKLFHTPIRYVIGEMGARLSKPGVKVSQGHVEMIDGFSCEIETLGHAAVNDIIGWRVFLEISFNLSHIVLIGFSIVVRDGTGKDEVVFEGSTPA